jgi:hypothetical protein
MPAVLRSGAHLPVRPEFVLTDLLSVLARLEHAPFPVGVLNRAPLVRILR